VSSVETDHRSFGIADDAGHRGTRRCGLRDSLVDLRHDDIGAQLKSEIVAVHL
jgi:hypothetical protein